MRIEEATDLPLEAEPADVAEQGADGTVPDTDDAEVQVSARHELPLEADPADVAEQDRAVPYDEDDER